MTEARLENTGHRGYSGEWGRCPSPVHDYEIWQPRELQVKCHPVAMTTWLSSALIHSCLHRASFLWL